MTRVKRITVIDQATNKTLEYDEIYLHSSPETNLVSLYVGGFDDNHRTIYRIMERFGDPRLNDKLQIRVKKF